MDRSDVQGWADRLRALAGRIETAEHGEELVEVTGELDELSASIRGCFPVAAARTI